MGGKKIFSRLNKARKIKTSTTKYYRHENAAVGRVSVQMIF
jgi:hypothetical protein